jgi:ABC-type sugar transport system substrate-binding protein
VLTHAHAVGEWLGKFICIFISGKSVNALIGWGSKTTPSRERALRGFRPGLAEMADCSIGWCDARPVFVVFVTMR